MHIGRETDYALRIVMYLVAKGHGVKVSAGEIAKAMSVPERFNLKILRKLALCGIVRSTRGIYGGFSLMTLPHELTLLQVIEAIEGPVALSRCTADDDFCGMSPAFTACPVKAKLQEASETLRNLLGSTTFAELDCTTIPAQTPQD